jgi:hypothetical protein
MAERVGDTTHPPIGANELFDSLKSFLVKDTVKSFDPTGFSRIGDILTNQITTKKESVILVFF